MTLGNKQRIFTRNVARLIEWAYENGYEITFGHALRCKDCPVGRKTSNHKIKLAVDLNLFKDGVYLTSTEDHHPLGRYWERLHPDNTWGGRFDDGNHYSMKHNGRR